MTTWHVSVQGSDVHAGSAALPFRSISRASQAAHPGDSVLVHEGEYGEWVAPVRGGLDEHRRITYEAAAGAHVVIKGSEPVSGWTRVDGSVWAASVPNSVFGGFNPFAEEVAGDWIAYPDANTPRKHLGALYLDGLSLYEVDDFAAVAEPTLRTETVDRWTGVTHSISDPASTRRVWHAEVGPDATVIRASFLDVDPRLALVEMNVRRSVFYPVATHIDYITVRGFELAHAATPWAPPTADQPGLVGPHWAKGWIIEDNVIHDSTCSGISLGKEASTGHNLATVRGDKPGYQYQLESVFLALRRGWDKESIGSHVVRRNTIYDCGQAGIVGHLGAIFSTIEDNEIRAIAARREFYGHEQAGIKLHAAIDVTIRRNRIHGCSLGTWLDWQTQGTRLTQNVYYDNGRDVFVEVSHGPYVLDHNVFGSRASLELFSQGGAIVHNLICGTLSLEAVLDRATPYHVPHSTLIAGYAVTEGGDDRYVGNLFLGHDQSQAYGPGARPGQTWGYGTAGYDGHPCSFTDYTLALADPTHGDHERFARLRQPVYIRDNAYLNGAIPYAYESGAVRSDADAHVQVIDEGEHVILELTVPSEVLQARLSVTTSDDLPPVRLAGAGFEDADGTSLRLDEDLIGEPKSVDRRYPPGPLAQLTSPTTRVRVW